MMKKKNGLTKNQKKFRDEYYKNPYICMELFNNSSSTNVSFLGFVIKACQYALNNKRQVKKKDMK